MLVIDEVRASEAAQVLAAGAPIWCTPRKLPTELAAYVQNLLAAPWFTLRLKVPVGAGTADAIERILATAGLPPGSGRRLFVEDIAALTELLAAAADCRGVEVRIEHDPGARCPVFHHDNNKLRLLCTYAGPGTEWLPEERLNRDELGLKDRAIPDANAAIARGPAFRAQAGEILIIKGRRYAYGHRSLVHKSPDRDLGPRVLVVVNPHSLEAR